MRCAESVRTQALVDGELDAISALNVERHLQQCSECSALQQQLQRTRATLKAGLPSLQASAQLRSRIHDALDQEDARVGRRQVKAAVRRWVSPAFWWGSLSGAAATAAAAMMYVMLSVPGTDLLVDSVAQAHVSALMSGRLVEVQSTDRHTVKPWFAGRVEFSPVVADFSAQGYRLVGARLEQLSRQRAAVMVYRHGAHVIDVFCWPAQGQESSTVTRHGYHLAFWRSGDLAYAAVSDTGWDELLGLQHLLRERGEAESRPKNSSAKPE